MESENLPKISGRIAGALQQTGTLLVKKGTVMGPLVPALSLVPVLGFLAWLLEDVFVYNGIPVFSIICIVGIVSVIGIYLAQYVRFARHDPDRLQSEEYRVQMRKLQMARFKDQQEYIPAEGLAETSSMLEEADERPTQPAKAAVEFPDGEEDESK